MGGPGGSREVAEEEDEEDAVSREVAIETAALGGGGERCGRS